MFIFPLTHGVVNKDSLMFWPRRVRGPLQVGSVVSRTRFGRAKPYRVGSLWVPGADDRKGGEATVCGGFDAADAALDLPGGLMSSKTTTFYPVRAVIRAACILAGALPRIAMSASSSGVFPISRILLVNRSVWNTDES